MRQIITFLALCGAFSIVGCSTTPITESRASCFSSLKSPISTCYRDGARETDNGAPGGLVTVRRGDTLSQIADRYGVSTRDLQAANGLSNPNRIYPGQRLALPGYTPATRTAGLAPVRQPAPMIGAPRPQLSPASLSPPPATGLIAASGPFGWPLQGQVIASFGSTSDGRRNDGINIAAPAGEPIRAAADGTVSYAGNEIKGFGNLVLVKHPNGFVTAYAHAARMVVAKGDTVRRGDVIAYVGQTGAVDQPQLHFEIRQGVTPVNPSAHLPQLYAAN
ncbi:MAG: peptidoglycan DD-metalloendopeptidase family protein [Alphaproteobacteria bacterium]|nr:peptidoglycan DD-metalloendopeptidase family protein [Alphaproteobacteria bacterium]